MRPRLATGNDGEALCLRIRLVKHPLKDAVVILKQDKSAVDFTRDLNSHFGYTDPDTLSFVSTESERNVVQQGELRPHFVYRVRVGETVVIPCRPTQPDVEVTFFKDSNLDEKHYTPVVYFIIQIYSM